MRNLTHTMGPLLWWVAALAALFACCGLWWWLRRARSSRRPDAGLGLAPEEPSHAGRHGLLWGLFVLLLALGVPVADILLEPPKPPVSLAIQCTASQWKWHFEYQSYRQAPLNGIAFVSAMRSPVEIDNQQLAKQLFGTTTPANAADELLDVDQPLILPVGAKVRFSITSEDSVHAWWIPAFSVKKEAIPGFIQTVEVSLPDSPGTYRGMCSQLCGQQHAFMPIVIKLLPIDAFEVWIHEQPTVLAAKQQHHTPDHLPHAALSTLGQSIYQQRCELCHGRDGNSLSPLVAPLSTSKLLPGAAPELLQLLLRGRNVMPGMRNILARDELASVASYLRLTWTDLPDAEAIVQPIDVPASF